MNSCQNLFRLWEFVPVVGVTMLIICQMCSISLPCSAVAIGAWGGSSGVDVGVDAGGSSSSFIMAASAI